MFDASERAWTPRLSPRPQDACFIGTKWPFNGWADVPTEMRDRCGLGIRRGSLVVANGIAREKFGVADEAIVDSTAHYLGACVSNVTSLCCGSERDSLPKWVNIGIFRCEVETVNNM